MANATFYLIQSDSPQATPEGLDAYAVFLAQHFVKQGAKVYVNCQHKAHAEALAERFWQVEPEQYIGHNLVGEGPKYGTQIEIGHQQVRPSWHRQLVINLAENETTFAHPFIEVVDFVPCDEKAKQQARERYKIYRQSGFQMQTIALEHH